MQDVTSFSYDKLGRLTGETDALAHSLSYGYDILRQKVSQTDAYGLVTHFTYDDLGRLEGIDYPEPDADVTFTYDAVQRRTMTDGLGTTTWEYDDLGRAEEITDPFNKTVGYGYDGQGNRTRLTYPDGKVANYAYDGLDRLEWVRDWESRETAYQYSVRGQLEVVMLPNGVTSLYDYTAVGRLDTITHSRGKTVLADYQYAYDLTGNRLQAVENVRQLVQGGGPPPGWTPPAEFGVEEQGYQAAVLGWPELGTGGYTLERSTDGVNWQAVATLDADTQRYIDEGLARHTQYWYRLIPDGGQGTPVGITAETGSEPVTYVDEGSATVIFRA